MCVGGGGGRRGRREREGYDVLHMYMPNKYMYMGVQVHGHSTDESDTLASSPGSPTTGERT